VKNISFPQDIEQLVATGRQVKGCPYYGSRQAVEDAQVSK
jgi:DEAD_2